MFLLEKYYWEKRGGGVGEMGAILFQTSSQWRPKNAYHHAQGLVTSSQVKGQRWHVGSWLIMTYQNI